MSELCATSELDTPISYRLAEANPDNPFLFWAAMGTLSLVALPFLKGVWRVRKPGPQLSLPRQ